MGDPDDAAARFEDASLQRLEATVLLASRTFVRLELPAPWAPTTIPLPDADLAKGETVLVAGHPDAELDQQRAPRPGASLEQQPGFRVLVVAARSRHFAVVWPTSAPADAAPSDAPDLGAENDWSDV